MSVLLPILVLVGGLAIYSALANTAPKAAVSVEEPLVLRQVQAKKIESTSVEQTIPIDGRLSAYEEVTLSAKVAGILRETPRKVRKGSFFAKGELLFDIEQTELQYSLNAQRSQLYTTLNALLPELEVDYPAVFPTWNTYVDDFNIEGALPPLPISEGKTEKRFIASKSVFNLYYNIKAAEAQLSFYKIYAPFAGIVIETHAYPGALVSPGARLVKIIGANAFELEASLTEKELPIVKVGSTVLLTSSLGDQTWTGRISRIGKQIDKVTQKIPIYIRVNGSKLNQGMYLQGSLKALPLENVTPIAKELIVDQEYIYTLKDSVVSLQKLLIQGSNKEAVFATGMDSDTWIITDNPNGLVVGQKVNPVFN